MLTKQQIVANVPSPFHHCRERLHRFLHERKSWDGANGMPAHLAGATRALAMLKVAYAAGIEQPSCVLGSGGEVALIWQRKGDLYVTLECFEDSYLGLAIDKKKERDKAFHLDIDQEPTVEVLDFLVKHFPAPTVSKLKAGNLSDVLSNLSFWSPVAKGILEGFAVDDGRGYCASLETIRKVAWLLESAQHGGIVRPQLDLLVDGAILLEWEYDWNVSVEFNDSPTYSATVAPATHHKLQRDTRLVTLTSTFDPDAAPAIMPVLRRHCAGY
ncbi:hypothetical protein ACYPKM_05285 [Pseudomonas aeruginosa]